MNNETLTNICTYIKTHTVNLNKKENFKSVFPNTFVFKENSIFATNLEKL